MSTYQTIKVLDDGDIVSLVLNRPPVNVLNIAMMKEINTALSELQRHPRAKVLLVKAEGKAFSAGVDVGDHAADRVASMIAEFDRIFELLDGFKVPVIACVDGAALGGGCEVALFCDMVIASDRAKFGQPEIKVGVFPPVAAAALPRLVGKNRTMELLMTGDTITAAEVERIGLINKVFPTDGFETHVAAFVAKIAANSKIVLELTKQAVNGGLRRNRMEAVQYANRLYMDEMMKTADAHEGIAAFLEKRQPVWSNR